MGVRYLIDTNIASDYLIAALPQAGQAFVAGLISAVGNISVITQIELLVWIPMPVISVGVQLFLDASNIFDLASNVIAQTVLVRTKYRLKLPDAIIAGTALAHNLTLVTRNRKDFDKIAGLQIINPWEL